MNYLCCENYITFIVKFGNVWYTRLGITHRNIRVSVFYLIHNNIAIYLSTAHISSHNYTTRQAFGSKLHCDINPSWGRNPQLHYTIILWKHYKPRSVLWTVRIVILRPHHIYYIICCYTLTLQSADGVSRTNYQRIEHHTAHIIRNARSCYCLSYYTRLLAITYNTYNRELK